MISSTSAHGNADVHELTNLSVPVSGVQIISDGDYRYQGCVTKFYKLLDENLELKHLSLECVADWFIRRLGVVFGNVYVTRINNIELRASIISDELYLDDFEPN